MDFLMTCKLQDCDHVTIYDYDQNILVQLHWQNMSATSMEKKAIRDQPNLSPKHDDFTVCENPDDDKSHRKSSEEKQEDESNGKFINRNKFKKVHSNCVMDEASIAETIHVFDKRENDVKTGQIYNDTYNGGESKTDLKEQRAKINLRERKRMHDLNQAMESLREVMPYANGPTMRKLSKIATLSLARNYIQMLTRSIEELKIMLDDAYRTHAAGPTMARRRHAISVHPYRQFVGIGNMDARAGMMNSMDGFFPTCCERYVNISGNSSRNIGTCVGLGCCPTPNVNSMQNGLQNNTCSTWTSST